jgi:16S rRNA C967 or C1407 C5-methylase (RsmB/RsmF family)
VKKHKALLQQQLASHRKSGKAVGHVVRCVHVRVHVCVRISSHPMRADISCMHTVTASERSHSPTALSTPRHAPLHQEKIRLPRYVRVNTLKTTLDEAIKHYEMRGYRLTPTASASGGNLLNPGKGTMVVDEQIPNLLALPAGCSLHRDPLVERGAVILQDRCPHACCASNLKVSSCVL